MPDTNDYASVKEYQNPLDNYRSYSFHYVLTVSSSSQEARRLLGDSRSSASGSELFSKIQDTKLGERIKSGNSDLHRNTPGRSFLLIDTRRFSHFTISSLTASHVFGTGNSKNPTSPAAEMSFTINDSTGLTFFNLLRHIQMNEIGSSKFAPVYILSVMFIGHKDDGNSDTVEVTHIPIFIASTEVKYHASGSTINVEAVEQESGITSIDSPFKVLNNTGMVKSIAPKRNTLGDVMRAFEDSLNAESAKFFIKHVRDNAPADGRNIVNGKLVQYMITLPNEEPHKWEDFIFTENLQSLDKSAWEKIVDFFSFSNNDTKVANLQDAAAQRPDPISLSEDQTITQAIDTIMRKCLRISSLTKRESFQAGTAISYKISTNITSDEFSYIVHFDIIPFHTPLVDGNGTTKQQQFKSISSDTKAGGKVKNLIEYSYLFSGKNNHILDMDISFKPITAAWLNWDPSGGQTKTSRAAEAGQKTDQVREAVEISSSKIVNVSGDIGPADPIFMGFKADEAAINYTNGPDVSKLGEAGSKFGEEINRRNVENISYLASMHYISSISLDVKIRGNPNLFRKFAKRHYRDDLAPHTTSIVNADLLRNFNSPNLGVRDRATIALQRSIKDAFKTAREEYRKFYNEKIQLDRRHVTNNGDSLDGPSVYQMPLFVRIDIKAPMNDDLGNFSGSSTSETSFSNKFFYRGVYRVLTVTSNFSGSTFTQDLALTAYDPANIYSGIKSTESKQGKRTSI